MNTNYNSIDSMENMAKLCTENSKEYKFKLLMFTLLGYAYIGIILLLLVACIGIIFYALLSSNSYSSDGISYSVFQHILRKLFILIVPIIFLILRSLWIRIPKPEGLPISHKNAPELFDMIEDIRKTTNAAKINSVLITNEFNAAVCQIPMLGLFGFYRNYLIIGLPIMMALSKDELKSVLSHEIGHLSHNHSRFSNWIYRMRSTWLNIYLAFENRSRIGSFLFKHFINWYYPRYNEMSLSLIRLDEYEADKFSVDAVGAETTASCLLNFCLKYSFFDEVFWKKVNDKTFTDSNPPSDLYNQLLDTFKEEVPTDKNTKWLKLSLKEKESYEDTHPTLKQRLNAIGVEPFIPETVKYPAIDLLENSMNDYINEFNELWFKAAKEAWEEQYKELQECKQKLYELECKGDYKNLTSDEQWDFIALTDLLKGTDSALPFYFKYAKTNPYFAPAQFAIGNYLLDQNDETGIKYLEKAMELDKETILSACELIYKFLICIDKDEDAEKYYEMAENHALLVEKFEEEQCSLSTDDTFLPANFDEDEINHIQSILSNHKGVTDAYLVEKKIDNPINGRPTFVLCLDIDPPFSASDDYYDDTIDAVLDELDLNREILVMHSHGSFALSSCMCIVENSLIYEKKKRKKKNNAV